MVILPPGVRFMVFVLPCKISQRKNCARYQKSLRPASKNELEISRLIQSAMDCLESDIKGAGVKKADLIIEAVFED